MSVKLKHTSNSDLVISSQGHKDHLMTLQWHLLEKFTQIVCHEANKDSIF